MYIFLLLFCDTRDFLSCSHRGRSYPRLDQREARSQQNVPQSPSYSHTCPSISQGMEKEGKAGVWGLNHGIGTLPGMGVLAD